MDSVWSWITCLSCSLAVALALGFSYSYGVLLPVLMKYFSTSTGTTGTVYRGKYAKHVSEIHKTVA